MSVIVVPWYSDSEWIAVRNQILSSNKSEWADAKARFYCWKARVERLPAGVETTLCLLEAKLSPHSHETDPSIRLTLAAAVNRFLNHISHIGKHRHSCDTFDEAVIRFGIPNWLVDLRHETTHGSMMNLDYLRSGLDFCWNWIRMNYWDSSSKSSDSDLESNEENRDDCDAHQDSETEDEVVDQRLSPALECYFYLNIYKVWKTRKVSELMDQPQLFNHLQELWNKAIQNYSAKKRRKLESFQNLFVKDAINFIKRIVLDAAQKNMKNLIDILLSEQLFFPQLDILKSLVQENQEIKKPYVLHQGLPPSLIEIWSEIIKFIGEKEMLPDLLMSLVKIFERGSQTPRYIHSMTSGWILEITRGIIPSQKEGKMLNLPHPECFNDFVSHCVLFPGEYSKYFIETIFHLRSPRWAPEKEQQVILMINAFDNTSLEVEEDYELKNTVTELEDSKWKPAVEMKWNEYPLGYMFGREYEFDVPINVRNKLAESVENFPPSTLFKLGKINWNNDQIEYVSTGPNGILSFKHQT